MSDLESVLSGQVAQETESTEQPAQEVIEPTGEEVAATPAEPQDDPMERHRKGLEAAAVAERGKRHAAEARAQALEQQLQKYLDAQQQPKQQEGAPDPNDPKYQENPQEYWRLLARHEAREELKQRDESERARRENESQRTAEAAFKDRIGAVVTKGQERYSDFDAVTNSGLAPFLNPTMHQAIGLGENGHEVAYWLGKNPAEAARISQLPPMLMVLELGKVSAKASTPAQQPIPRTLTTARDTRGQFAAGYQGPTPLESVFTRK